jgi:adenylate kinase family enzyme
MRVVVIGTSGSGKSTMAAAIGQRFGVTVVELDALNWRPGWEAVSRTDPPAFFRAVDEATAGDAWVVAGNYTMVRHIVWARATHLVWLDYPRWVVMARVIRRSFGRAWRRETVWGGNQEGFRLWLDPSHPIQWAWRTWQSNRTATISRLSEAAAAHLVVVQVMRVRDAPKVLERLTPPRAP